jgi:hypothetical protein
MPRGVAALGWSTMMGMGGWLELLVQDNAKKRAMHLQAAVVLDEAQLSEFVHEEVHP